MVSEKPTRYTPRDLQITAAPQIPFWEPSLEEVKLFWGEEGIRQKREAHNHHNARLASIDIEDEESQRSLFAQAISAIDKYPKEKRELHTDFHPFAYFTEPNGNRFLVGDIEGTWDLANGSFELRSILIWDVVDTVKEMQELMDVIKHHNPSPRVGSNSFSAALKAAK